MRAFFDANTRFNMKKSFDHFDRHFRTRQNTDKGDEKYRQGCLYFFDRARLFCVFNFEQKIKDEQKANSVYIRGAF